MKSSLGGVDPAHAAGARQPEAFTVIGQQVLDRPFGEPVGAEETGEPPLGVLRDRRL